MKLICGTDNIRAEHSEIPMSLYTKKYDLRAKVSPGHLTCLYLKVAYSSLLYVLGYIYGESSSQQTSSSQITWNVIQPLSLFFT